MEQPRDLLKDENLILPSVIKAVVSDPRVRPIELIAADHVELEDGLKRIAVNLHFSGILSLNFIPG